MEFFFSLLAFCFLPQIIAEQEQEAIFVTRIFWRFFCRSRAGDDPIKEKYNCLLAGFVIIFTIWNIRGPKLICFYPFKRCFCQIKKLNVQNFQLCDPNLKQSLATFGPQAVHCACLIYTITIV